jgi:hypothetical protein
MHDTIVHTHTHTTWSDRPGERLGSGLRRLKRWIYSTEDPPKKAPAKLKKQARAALSRKHEMLVRVASFKWTHRNVKAQWELSSTFPQLDVVQAYVRPMVSEWTLMNMRGCEYTYI